MELFEALVYLRDQLVVPPGLLQVQVPIFELKQLAILEILRLGVDLNGLLVRAPHN